MKTDANKRREARELFHVVLNVELIKVKENICNFCSVLKKKFPNVIIKIEDQNGKWRLFLKYFFFFNFWKNFKNSFGL
jgi:hypothetical protein